MNYIPYNSNIITRYNSSVLVDIIKQLVLKHIDVTKFKLKQLRLLYNSTRDGYDFNVYRDKVQHYNNLVILIKCNTYKSNDSYVFGMFSSIKYSFQSNKPTSNTNSVGFNDKNSILFSISDSLIIKPKSQRGVDILNGYPTCFELFNKGCVNVNELNRMFDVKHSNFNQCLSSLEPVSMKLTNFDITNIEVYRLNCSN